MTRTAAHQMVLPETVFMKQFFCLRQKNSVFSTKLWVTLNAGLVSEKTRGVKRRANYRVYKC